MSKDEAHKYEVTSFNCNGIDFYPKTEFDILQNKITRLEKALSRCAIQRNHCSIILQAAHMQDGVKYRKESDEELDKILKGEE